MANNIELTVGDVTYPSLSDASKAIGCSTTYLRGLLKKYPDKAELDKVLKNYKKQDLSMELAGCQFTCIRDFLRQTSIQDKTFRRMRKTMTKDELEDWVLSNAEGFYVLGKWYWCISDCAQQLDIEKRVLEEYLDKYDYSQRVLDNKIRELLQKTTK